MNPFPRLALSKAYTAQSERKVEVSVDTLLQLNAAFLVQQRLLTRCCT